MLCKCVGFLTLQSNIFLDTDIVGTIDEANDNDVNANANDDGTDDEAIEEILIQNPIEDFDPKVDHLDDLELVDVLTDEDGDNELEEIQSITENEVRNSEHNGTVVKILK